MSATDDLLLNNQDYARRFAQGDLPARPSKKVAVLACMDARMDVHRILGLAEGDAHVIRNAGGAVTEDAIRSLLVSQRILGTREVIVIHHTDCGMAGLREEEVAKEIEEETGIVPPFPLGGFADLEQHVRDSVAKIRGNPLLPVDEVRGFVYDVATGALREVPTAPG